MLDQRAAELGYPRSRSTAPLEHWKSIPIDRLERARREVGIEVLVSYYRARFGGVPVTSDEAERLKRVMKVLSE
jgi:hypothetical protein